MDELKYNKMKSREFWDAVIADAGPEDLENAEEVYSILCSALSAIRTPEQLALVKKAQEELADDGVLEIDDDALVSTSDDDTAKGAYVMAWVWVNNDA